MKKKSFYPITLKLLSDRRSFVYEVFRKVSPHKETFIGVCELEGTFLCEEQSKLYDSLVIGERLSVVFDATNRMSVKRQDGTDIGIIPVTDSVLPSMLISRDLNVFAYFEAKEFENDMLTVAVSLYCDKY